jgi:hypothetical protein
LLREPTCFDERVQLIVYVLCVTRFARPNSANRYNFEIGIDAIDDAKVCELMLPIIYEWPTQRQSVALGINRQFLL